MFTLAKRGRKKGSGKSRSYNTKRKNAIDIDIAMVLCLILAILSFIILFGNKGVMGKVMNPIMGGLIGSVKYIVPFAFISMAISLVKDDREYAGSKLVQYIFLIGCICSILNIYQISSGNIDGSKAYNDSINASYALGQRAVGGGALGAIISYPLIALFGMFGAGFVSIGISLIMIIFIFGIHPSEMIANILDGVDERRAYRKDEIEEQYERMQERRNVRRKEKAVADATKTSARISDNLKTAPMIDESQITINLDEQEEKPEHKKHKFRIFGLGDDEEELEGEIEEPQAAHSQSLPENNSVQEHNPNELGDLFVKKEEEKADNSKQVLNLQHNETIIDDENYEFPPVELLKENRDKGNKTGKKALTDTATKLQKTLYSFGVSAKVEHVSVGPAITRFELKPAEGVRVSKIAKLSDDIALNLAAESIRIEAPIPGKQAVGIEIPNAIKEIVPFRDIIESDEFEKADSKISMGLGKDIGGNVVVTNIGKMPHMLIAGATGSGKSVCINTLITSILYKAKPSEARLLLIDPKVVELSVYNGIPHLLIPVVTDPKKAAGALAWAVQEMENRYALFADKGVRDLKGYNEKLREEGLTEKLPQIVIVIDELADLMMVASKDVEDSICRLAQKARAAGMHLVIATQRPSVDVITGIIKANIPSRIAFAVSSQIDSRTILDMAGAEKLLGKGDMLFYPIGASKPQRIQGAFVSDDEVEKIVDYIKFNGGEANYNESIIEQIENANKTDQERDAESQESADDTDEYLEEAIDTVIMAGTASTSYIQRKFKVGYARAGRIIDQMEQRGIISGYEGSKPRRVLISKEQWEEQKMQVDNFKAEHPEMFQEES
jgi:S-DNA-T family DNA segregation ATPase FtsK/SpoIIIE